MDNELTWTAQNGATIRVVVTAHTYTLFVNGKETLSTGVFSEVPAAVASKARAAGIVKFLGPVGVTQERHDLLTAMQAAQQTQRQYQHNALTDLYTLEAERESAYDLVLSQPENPAPAYARMKAAEDALTTWKAEHRDLWDAEMSRREAATAAKKAELAQSYARRGLD